MRGLEDVLVAYLCREVVSRQVLIKNISCHIVTPSVIYETSRPVK